MQNENMLTTDAYNDAAFVEFRTKIVQQLTSEDTDFRLSNLDMVCQ